MTILLSFCISKPVQANEDNGQLEIEINRINENKTKIDSTENNVEGIDDLFTDESVQLETIIKNNEKKQTEDTLNSLFKKGFTEEQNNNLETTSAQLFQEKITLNNIKKENLETKSSAYSWLFVTVIIIIIVILCGLLFLLLKKLNTGVSNE